MQNTRGEAIHGSDVTIYDVAHKNAIIKASFDNFTARHSDLKGHQTVIYKVKPEEIDKSKALKTFVNLKIFGKKADGTQIKTDSERYVIFSDDSTLKSIGLKNENHVDADFNIVKKLSYYEFVVVTPDEVKNETSMRVVTVSIEDILKPQLEEVEG